MRQEYILCAAIYNGTDVDTGGRPLIYCGHRHHKILWQSEHVSRKSKHQGFLTNTGRFVDREEALIIAGKSGQLRENYDWTCGGTLFSEDLY